MLGTLSHATVNAGKQAVGLGGERSAAVEGRTAQPSVNPI
ncbi:hypothetical protein PSNTI_21620 [Stutzerimonas stutzeri]|nr:hypothetical protein PSNTI_21620 [Stutzerimonas stutzeri]